MVVPSQKKLMLEECNQAFGHAKKTIIEAYDQAINEGFLP